ncbi:hypothetical protein CKO23_02675 [Thiocystis violacea]|nr:hypothetical protein [Thiocystis violacea]
MDGLQDASSPVPGAPQRTLNSRIEGDGNACFRVARILSRGLEPPGHDSAASRAALGFAPSKQHKDLVVRWTGRVDERERSPPNPAPLLVDCAALVHPTEDDWPEG